MKKVNMFNLGWMLSPRPRLMFRPSVLATPKPKKVK